MSSTILGFIKSGVINGARLGMTLDEAKESLGDPTDMSVNRKPLVLKYDDLELTFYRCKEGWILSSINIHNFDGEINLPFALEGWAPTEQTTVDEFVQRVDEAGISILPDESHSFAGRQVGYRSECGVLVLWDLEEGCFEGLFYYKDI